MSEIEFLFAVLRSLLWDAGTGVLIALLISAAWTDWRTMRIPNLLILFGMGWGLAYNTAHGFTAFEGLLFGLGGLATGLILFLPFWLLRAMGAGDVKLIAMVGAFLGTVATLKAVLLVGILGGVAVLIFALARRAVRRLMVNLKEIATSVVIPGMPLWRPELTGESIGKIPYGVSIGAGTFAFLMLRQLGFA